MNNYIELIHKMDFKSTATRRRLVMEFLDALNVSYTLQTYKSGNNLIVTLGKAYSYTAIACHLDRVKGSGGANDNGAAIASCLGVIQKYLETECQEPIIVMFFDEEETGRIGSQAYVKEFGHKHLKALINMELVGIGNELVIWPLRESNAISEIFERAWLNVYNKYKIKTNDPIYAANFPMYYSDADSFIDAGMEQVFTFTRITAKDRNLIEQYVQSDADELFFLNLLPQSDVMRTYHQPTDVSSTIDANAIVLNVEVVMAVILS